MKKIMFNEPFGLQQATFEGTKTMTRRIVPQVILDYVPKYLREYYAQTLCTISSKYAILNIVREEKKFQRYVYQFGEVVAIAQQYSEVFTDAYNIGLYGRTAGWNNKMFVKAEQMPHHIKITDRKLERLQDISDDDCMKEGIMEGEFINTWERYYYDHWGDCPNHITFRTPRAAFASLIDRIGKRGTWKSNPLVFAYEYKLID